MVIEGQETKLGGLTGLVHAVPWDLKFLPK